MTAELRSDPIWGPDLNAGRRLVVRIDYDDSPEDPCEWDVFKVYSFSRKHTSFRHPSEFSVKDIGFRRKLDAKTAFFLDYFEHGTGRWSLTGEGMQCPWDTAHFAGVLLLADPKAIAPDKREDQARKFLETYSNWCNSWVYGYQIETEDGDDVDSCWGFYSNEDVIAAINEAIGDRDVVVEVTGDCADIAKYHTIKNLEE